MGCSRCCERPKDLICLICHDWATRAAVREHGRMVPREKRAEMMGIVLMIYRGALSPDDGQRLFDELMNLRG